MTGTRWTMRLQKDGGTLGAFYEHPEQLVGIYDASEADMKNLQIYFLHDR